MRIACSRHFRYSTWSGVSNLVVGMRWTECSTPIRWIIRPPRNYYSASRPVAYFDRQNLDFLASTQSDLIRNCISARTKCLATVSEFTCCDLNLGLLIIFGTPANYPASDTFSFHDREKTIELPHSPKCSLSVPIKYVLVLNESTYFNEKLVVFNIGNDVLCVLIANVEDCEVLNWGSIRRDRVGQRRERRD